MKWPEAIATSSLCIAGAIIICFALSTCEGCFQARMDANRDTPTVNKEAE